MDSREAGKMAQEVHDGNVAIRKDGGAGSGPKKGSGRKEQDDIKRIRGLILQRATKKGEDAPW